MKIQSVEEQYNWEESFKEWKLLYSFSIMSNQYNFKTLADTVQLSLWLDSRKDMNVLKSLSTLF